MHHKRTNANTDPGGKANIDFIRKIVSKKKTTLPSSRNQN